MKIDLDAGYSFGIGCFETILVLNHGVLIKEHVDRINNSLLKLGIDVLVTEEEIQRYIRENQLENCALKISVSEKNKVFTKRKIGYKDEIYKIGAKVTVSEVLRNETSPLTYIKSLCYGENILEKRKASAKGFDEVIFKNTKGKISEGAVSNIFFIKDNVLITPDVSSGLLPGIIRKEVIKRFPVIERKIGVDELEDMDGAFITNSLMGLLWVNSIEDITYRRCELYNKAKKWYHDDLIENR